MNVAISTLWSDLYFVSSIVKIINEFSHFSSFTFCDSCGILSFFFEWIKAFEFVPIIVSRHFPFLILGTFQAFSF